MNENRNDPRWLCIRATQIPDDEVRIVIEIESMGIREKISRLFSTIQRTIERNILERVVSTSKKLSTGEELGRNLGVCVPWDFLLASTSNCRSREQPSRADLPREFRLSVVMRRQNEISSFSNARISPWSFQMPTAFSLKKKRHLRSCLFQIFC